MKEDFATKQVTDISTVTSSKEDFVRQLKTPFFKGMNTQSKSFSGELTSPLRTKRQHYPRFDTLRMHKAIILLSAPPDSGPNQIYPYE